MAMPRLADLVNKMNFQGRLATSAIQIASFPEFLPVPSQESHLVLFEPPRESWRLNFLRKR